MGSEHSYHPDTHENGLADNCERCYEHATFPFRGLDQRNLALIIERVRDNLPARSANEAIVIAEMKNSLAIAQAINRVAYDYGIDITLL